MATELSPTETLQNMDQDSGVWQRFAGFGSNALDLALRPFDRLADSLDSLAYKTNPRLAKLAISSAAAFGSGAIVGAAEAQTVQSEVAPGQATGGTPVYGADGNQLTRADYQLCD